MFITIVSQSDFIYLNYENIITIKFIFILANCSAHSVKVGKRCTAPTADGSFEKSFVWIVDKTTVKMFDQKINKKNCSENS